MAQDLNQVAIDNIPDRNGQMLRNDLIDRMYGKGRPSKPLFHLVVTLRSTIEDLGIQADATSTRSLMNTYAEFYLLDAKQKAVLKGTGHSVSSFNKLANQYGTLAAEESAYQRTIFECSEQIVNRVSLYLAERPKKTPPEKPSPDERDETPPSHDEDDSSANPGEAPAGSSRNSATEMPVVEPHSFSSTAIPTSPQSLPTDTVLPQTGPAGAPPAPAAETTILYSSPASGTALPNPPSSPSPQK